VTEAIIMISSTEITVSASPLILFLVLTVIINVMQNAFACYMKLGHFKEAHKCADYIKSLMPDYLKTYLLYGLLAYFNNGATLSQVRKGLQTVKEGVAIAGLATANSQSFLPLLKSLEKHRDLLEDKVRMMIRTQAKACQGLVDKAIKIEAYQREKGVVKTAQPFARAYEDYKLISK
jgi:hypothetical protein